MEMSDNEREFLDAASNGDLETIKSLTSSGKIPLEKQDKIRNKRGKTALMSASYNGHLEVVSFLIENNSVNVNEKNEYGRTALHWASYVGHEKVMEYLIKKGASINQQTNVRGYTALHFASLWSQVSSVEILLEMGADPHIKDNRNMTALDCARQYQRSDVVNAILQQIQRQEQMQQLIQCHDRLPIAIWPDALNRLKSVRLIFQLVCEVPHLFLQVAKGEEESQQKESQGPKFSGMSHQQKNHPEACNKKRKRQTQQHEGDGKIKSRSK